MTTSPQGSTGLEGLVREMMANDPWSRRDAAKLEAHINELVAARATEGLRAKVLEEAPLYRGGMEQMINLGLELVNYIEELYCVSRVCERPTADGEKCVQCCERERVIDKLKGMVLRHYANTPYYEQVSKQWPPTERPAGAGEQQK